MTTLVGVTMRVVESPTYYEPRDAVSHDWIRLLANYDVIPILIPNVMINPEALLRESGISAVLLTGGNDLAKINGSENDSPQDAAPERDETEFRVLKFAADQNMPVLGVCRGLQVINCFFGGGVVRDLTAISGAPDSHVGRPHRIEISDSSYRSRLGVDRAITNSFHMNAVTDEKLALPLRTFARTDDGVTEGLYHPSHPIVAVQWHMERENSAEQIDRVLIQSWLRGA